MHRIAISRLLISCCLPVLMANTRVADTVHNLSSTGPGQLKSQAQDQVCAFCHAPHKPNKGPGMWNREMPVTAGVPGGNGLASGQAMPGEKSAMCMSCHDGTVALGAMIRPPRGGSASDLSGVFVTGRGRFGQHQTNHHPIGVPYDDGVVVAVPGLVNRSAVDLPLDDGRIECITCHDPHFSEFPPFLRKTSERGELCTTCHDFGGDGWDWYRSVHALSDATPQGGDPWRGRKDEWKGKSVAENGCDNCHAPHNAATANNLLVDVEERTCFRCHNGTVADQNLQVDFQKPYGHPVDMLSGADHGEPESILTSGRPFHAECEDCHNPHAAQKDGPMISFNPANPISQNLKLAPEIDASLAGVWGLNIDGQPVEEAQFEFEVCMKCHGVQGRSSCDRRRCSTAAKFEMNRQDETYNLRDKIDAGNPTLVSYHPFYTNDAANNAEVPSLRTDIPMDRINSKIYCNDCHSSENSPAAGGLGASGPHGSRFNALLAMNYDLTPGARAGVRGSSLCFKCHESANLLSDVSFPHRKHVVDEGASCANCHDPHGSAVYPHLINFMTSARFGGQTFEIIGLNGESDPIWTDAGQYSGTCSLSCHGVVHDGTGYGSATEIMQTGN